MWLYEYVLLVIEVFGNDVKNISKITDIFASMSSKADVTT